MGAGNVKAVYALWGTLPDPAFRLLAFMALIAGDDDQPPQFWGGRELLATGLGRRPPFDAADYRAVDRAMKKLRNVGALVQSRHASPMTTAQHDLVLSPDAVCRVNNSVDDGEERANTRHAASGEHTTRGGTNTRRATDEHTTPGDATDDAPRRPEEQEEQQRLTSGETNHSGAQVAEGVDSASGHWPWPLRNDHTAGQEVAS